MNHTLTIHEWDAGILTWECTCGHTGNAPYGKSQLERQIDGHMESHANGKNWKKQVMAQAAREMSRPLNKREMKERYEEKRSK